MTQKNILISYRTAAAFGLGAALALLALLLANGAGASSSSAGAQVAAPPQLVSYQGTIDVSDQPFAGTGFFKFALVNSTSGDGTGNYWANDGTASGEPGQSVPLTVSDGLFSVLLGDTTVSGMTTALADSAFGNGDAYLRVWFSQELGGPYESLEPNQRISSVPYALRASHAAYAETGAAMVPAGAVMFFDAGSCPSGWSELTEARGRTVVGLPGGGALKGTQGAALANLENRNHTHAVNPASVSTSSTGSHTHTTGEPTRKGGVGLTTGGFIIAYGEDDHLHINSTTGSHNHSVNIGSTTSTTADTGDVIPYIQLLACKKD